MTSRGRAFRRSPHRWGWIFLSLLFVAFSVVYFTQDIERFHTASVRAHGDGNYYYAYLHSLAFDRDVDFENNYQQIGNQFGTGPTETGKPGNVFTIGPALFWLPSLAATHATLAIGRWLDLIDDPLDGTTLAYQRGTFFGSVVWGFVAIAVVIVFAGRYATPFASAGAAAGLLLATPLTWYLIRQPSYSHAISACAVALFVLFWAKTLYTRTRRQWALLGLLAGVAMLVRPQNVGHQILPLVEWLIIAWRARSDRKLIGKHVLDGVFFACSALLAFSPQMLAWLSIYGTPITVPQGRSFMKWGASRWEAALFSGRQGLFAWHPLTYLAVIALALRAILPLKLN